MTTSKSTYKLKSNKAFNKLRNETIKKIQSYVKDSTISTGLNEETKESADELILINKLGLLTTDSQQGRTSRGEIPSNKLLYFKLTKQMNREIKRVEKRLNRELTKSELKETISNLHEVYKYQGGKFTINTDMKEKAYLNGYIDIQRAYWLSTMLNQQDNIIAFYTLARTNQKDQHICEKKCKKYIQDTKIYIPVTFADIDLNEGFSSPFPHYPLINVTHINNGFWPILTDSNVQSMTDDGSIKLPQYMNKYFAYISIIDARFGHHVRNNDGLFKGVIKALKELNSIQNIHLPIWEDRH